MIIFCAQGAYAQNVTITKPTKKETTTSSNSNSSSSSKKTTPNNPSKRQTQTSNSSTQQSQTSSRTQSQISKPTGSINGHEYVDLGLSIKWATCNVGASSPSDYGNYYAWGETSTKSSYTDENSVTFKKTMGSIAGNPTYDVARVSWGSPWRLPTKEEIDELVSKCKREWTTQERHNGYIITGPNGNSIFLPAAGWCYGTSLFDASEDGGYWSATPNEDDSDSAYCLGFDNGAFFEYRDSHRHGQSVRPVSE